MNFKIYNKGDYSSQLVEKLMITYRESNARILERYYMKKYENSSVTEDAFNKLKEDYGKFIKEFLDESEKNRFIAVIEDENNIACAGRFILRKEGMWLLEALETAEEYRKRKLATVLLKNVVDYLTAIGGKKVLANIYKNNEPSIKFHMKFGFKLNNEQPIDSYGEFSNNDEQYELIIKK